MSKMSKSKIRDQNIIKATICMLEFQKKEEFIPDYVLHKDFGLSFKEMIMIRTTVQEAVFQSQAKKELHDCGAMMHDKCICGTVLTKENIVRKACEDGCDICAYCGIEKCPSCGRHLHCGGCV